MSDVLVNPNFLVSRMDKFFERKSRRMLYIEGDSIKMTGLFFPIKLF